MKLSLSVVLLVILGGCAWTNSTAIREPEFNAIRFKRCVVFARLSDLSGRKRIENGVVTQLQLAHIQAVSSLRLFVQPPDPEVALSKFVAAGADTLLSISIDSATLSTGPTFATTTGSTTTVNTIHKPRMDFTADVTELASGKLVWRDSVESKGNGYANFNTTIDSFVEKVAEDIATEQLFTPGPSAEAASANGQPL